MPAYETDGEQIEAFKKIWKDYGRWIIIAVIFGLAIGLGWRYWQQQQIEHRQQASLLYQQLLGANEQNKADTVLQMSTELTRRFPQTGYAEFANLLAAKTAVAQNNLPMATEKLQWVIDHAHNPALKQIARLRAARILLAQKKPADAQKLLSVVDDKIYQSEIDEVQGDIYATLGDSAKARRSYQTAQVELSSTLGEDPYLSMKLAQP